MQETGLRNRAFGADKFGFKDLKEVHWNLDRAAALRACHRRRRRRRSSPAARSAPRPGITPAARPRTSIPSSMRSPKTPSGGTATASISQQHFENLLSRLPRHAKGKKLFAQDLYGGANPKYRIKTRVFTELAWHSLFIRTLLIRPERAELESFVPETHHHRPAVVQARRQAPWRPRRLRHDGGDRFLPQDRADLRHRPMPAR